MVACFAGGRQPWTGLLLGLLLVGPAGAEVHEDLEYRYYDVRVQEEEGLRQAINRQSPIWEQGQVFHGYTRWNVRWTFHWFQETSGRCRLTDAQVSLQSQVTLPRVKGVSSGQQSRLDTYLKALQRHELGHVEVGRQAAHAIDRHLLGLPPERDCGRLETAANAGGQRLLQHFQAQERQFDRDTGHGRSQGAYLED